MVNNSNSPATPDKEQDTVVLLLQVPRTNDKKELAAEQMFAALHGLLTFPPAKFYLNPKRLRVSFEIAVINRRIGFYICVPRYLKDFVEEQIYAQYPTVQIHEVDDYSSQPMTAETNVQSTELKLIANSALPIKTFQSFEVDPLASITAALAKFEDSEEAWIQLIVRPATATWHKKSEKYISGYRTNGNKGTAGLLSAFWAPPEQKAAGGSTPLTEYEQARARGAEEKSHKLAFETTLRIVYKGKTHRTDASLKIQSILATYKQFNTTYLNGFDQTKILEDSSLVNKYQQRTPASKPLILNIEEIATLYHLPHTSVETPYILWASSQTAEPPANLPLINASNVHQISPVGAANFRGKNISFGLPRIDRGRHLYILGQTGVGKSGLLELLTISDIYSGHGFAVIDPHGDYAMSVLKRIPTERAHDVIYFNPADTEFPIAFNPMEVTDPKLRNHTASELIGVLKRMFESWGPRLEYILRYSLLALLEYPDSTMLDITRILTEKKFRKEVLTYVTDPVVRNFWEVEFVSWNDKFAAEAVAPVLNKVGAFTASPLIRNIIGQPKSSFNIRKIMDERKILIVNLSRGLVGEDNAALLGSLLVTKIQLAAMSRADTSVELRVPFYLYVDEFQNFATDSFATILSEARKYSLNLTVANQYVAQMTQEVRDAVFGNVGSMVSFRMGADDARSMMKYFEPKFEEYDLIHMHNRHFVIGMTIDGEKSPAFSAISLDLPPYTTDQSPIIIENSRREYAPTRQEVEQYIKNHYHLEGSVAVPSYADRSLALDKPKKKPVSSPKPVDKPSPEPGIVDEKQSQPKPLPKEPVKPARNPETIHESKPEKIIPKIALGTVGHAALEATQIKDTQPTPDEPTKKKRKRKRSRKKKVTEEPSNTEATIDKKKPATSKAVDKPAPKSDSPAPTEKKATEKPKDKDDGEHVIFLR